MISICIPTYNRASRLEISLNNTIDVIRKYHDVNICVSDNDSDDNTYEIINKFRQDFPDILYKKNEYNLGFKKNFIKALSMSKARYRWLIGDDDYINELGFLDVLKYVRNSEKNYDLVIVNGDTGIEPSDQITRVITNRNEVLQKIGYHMTWISSIIFSSEFINKNNILEKMDKCENAFPHTTAIFESLPNKCNVLWVNSKTVVPIGGRPSYYNRMIEIFIKDWYLVISKNKNRYSRKALKEYLDKTPIDVRYLVKAKKEGIWNLYNLKIMFTYALFYSNGFIWITAFITSIIIPDFVFQFYKRLKNNIEEKND